MVTKVNVTVTAADQNGNPMVSAPVSAELSHLDVDAAGYVFPEKVEGVTGEDGKAVLQLWPNERGSMSSVYQFKVTNPDTGATVDLKATIPNTDCDLHLVASLPPYPGKTDGELMIDEAIAAVAPAVAAKNAAQEAEQGAGQNAEAAAQNKAGAEQAAGAAAAAANEAGQHRATSEQAAGQASDAATLAGQHRAAVEQSAGQVQEDKVAANQARTQAEDAAALAGQHRSAAEQGASDAGAAATQAGLRLVAVEQIAGQVQDNRTATEQARAQAEDAASASGQHRSASEQAAGQSVSAAEQSEQHRSAAEQAAQSAEQAAGQAQNHRNAAGDAKTQAEESAELAGQHRAAAEQAAGVANSAAGAAQEHRNAAQEAKDLADEAANLAGQRQAGAEQAAAVADAARIQAALSAAEAKIGHYVGEIRAFAFGAATVGWLDCDGAVYQIADKPALFAKIGSAYGGDGITTFAVPNLNGRVPRGAALGETGGGSATLTAPNMPQHSHSAELRASTDVGQTDGPTNGAYLSTVTKISGTGNAAYAAYRTGQGAGTQPLGGITVAAAGSETPAPLDIVPAYTGVRFCIAESTVLMTEQNLTSSNVTQEYLHVREEQPTGTNGYLHTASGAADEIILRLNATKANTIAGASLSGDTITLPAGRYQIRIDGPQHIGGPIKTQCVLKDTTNNIVLIEGKTSASSGVGTVKHHHTTLCGQFTLSAPTNLQAVLRLSAGTGFAVTLGTAASFGTEVYTEVEITKVA